MHHHVTILLVAGTAAGLLGLAPPAAQAAVDGILVQRPELVVERTGAIESLALPGTAYRDFTVSADAASFVIEDQQLPAGSARIAGHGITQVSWQPEGSSTRVNLLFGSEPASSLINTVPATKLRPAVPQVLAGFAFTASAGEPRRHPVVGSYSGEGRQEEGRPYGEYQLPKYEKVKYSDVLVTLQVTNVDFRDVLWLLSEIGNVSIVLDPYWADEPTGGRRAPGAGADPGAGGDSGGGPGFRDGSGFLPTAPREGTGRLSLNFNEVPFDQALELVVMAAGLVKVDIWPQGS